MKGIGSQRSEPWPSSGYHTLEIDNDGWLVPGAAFFRHLLRLPELVPILESCDNEIALHERLMENPGCAVEAADIGKLADADARENYRYFIIFRSLLDAAGTIEGAYLRLVDPSGDVDLPPFFARLLAQLSVRRVLDQFEDALAWRVAELFFRPQKASVEAGVLLADAELLERRRQPGGITMLQRLIHEAQGKPPGPADGLDILSAETAEQYWMRSEHHDMALDLTPGREGSEVLCRLLEAWLYHFHRLAGSVEGVKAIEGNWPWHIGLDAASNSLLNQLYLGATLEESAQAPILGLFRLTLPEHHLLLERVRGLPVYLAIAMAEDQRVDLKPQNLLVNLPLTEPD